MRSIIARFSENLIATAKGADLMIHEVAARRDPEATQKTDSVLAHHTTPEQAGDAFTRIRAVNLSAKFRGVRV